METMLEQVRRTKAQIIAREITEDEGVQRLLEIFKLTQAGAKNLLQNRTDADRVADVRKIVQECVALDYRKLRAINIDELLIELSAAID